MCMLVGGKLSESETLFSRRRLIYVQVQSLWAHVSLLALPLMGVLSVYRGTMTRQSLLGTMLAGLLRTFPLGYLSRLKPLVSGLCVAALPVAIGLEVLLDGWAETSGVVLGKRTAGLRCLPFACWIIAVLGRRLRLSYSARSDSSRPMSAWF